MALLFCDGADHYTTNAQGMLKWSTGTSNAGGGTLQGGSGNGRISGNSVRINGGSSGGELTKTGFGSPATVILGFALNKSNWASLTLARLYGGGAMHIDIRTDAAGKPFVTRNGTTLGSVAADALGAGWNYFEIKVTIHDTTGAVELRVNGATVVGPLTNQDTRNAGTAVVDTFAFPVGTGGDATRDYDDVILCDTTGSFANDFLGDVRVQTILPDGNGNTSNLVGSDANSVDNYLLVDEATPNDDTDYVESATPGDKDTYTYGALTALTGTVHAVVTYARAKKTDAGTRQIATVARVAGTEEDGATKTLSLSYGLFSDIRHEKPGGGAWSISDVNGAEFGVKVIA